MLTDCFEKSMDLDDRDCRRIKVESYGEPTIRVRDAHSEGSGFDLTCSEARELAAVLTEAADWREKHACC